MRIAIDGRALTKPAGGVRRYITQLWRAMAEVEPAVSGLAIGGEAAAAADAGLRHRAVTARLPTNLGWSMWALPRAVARAQVDVFHAPAYTAPLWGARPLVVTIHDVSYARHPEWYPYTSDPLRQAFYRRSARRADRIITDSTFSRDEIVAAYGLDPDRIDVIPLGVSGDFYPDPSCVRERVVLHVGDLHPRRNLSLLVETVANLRRSAPGLAGVSLVLVGTDRGEIAGLRQLATQLGVSAALHHVSNADDAEVRGWYQRASVLAYPSRYEGFGLPVLEAMACGLPVVASDAASLPEVVGEAGVLVSPDDRDGWGRALREVLENPDHAAALSEAGQKRAQRFSWKTTAERTAAVYRRARAGRQPPR